MAALQSDKKAKKEERKKDEKKKGQREGRRSDTELSDIEVKHKDTGRQAGRQVEMLLEFVSSLSLSL